MSEIVNKDPVCGMDVEPGHEAARFDHGGKTYLFCNPGCKDEFAKNPSACLKAEQTGPAESKKRWWKFGK